MRFNLRYKLLAIVGAAALVPLAAAVIHSILTFQQWAATETRDELAEQRRVFDAFVDDRTTRHLESLSRFAQEARTVQALKSSDRSRLLTLAISEAEAMVAEAFYLISDDEDLVIDPVGMTRRTSSPAMTSTSAWRFHTNAPAAWSTIRPSASESWPACPSMTRAAS